LMSRAGVGRNLHIAVLPTLATTWLLPQLAEFRRLRPDITVSLSVRTLPFQFNDQPFDAAIYHASQMWPGTRGIKLFDEVELLPVCAASMLDAVEKGGLPLRNLLHLHTTSRPDAWRRWYTSHGMDYLPTMN